MHWINFKIVPSPRILFLFITILVNKLNLFLVSNDQLHIITDRLCSYACTSNRSVPRIWEGGAKKFFFRFGNLHVAKPCALLGGFGGMLPRENFLKRCNLVRFRVYFDQILSLFFSKNAIFYIKNKYFRYTFVMGYFS